MVLRMQMPEGWVSSGVVVLAIVLVGLATWLVFRIGVRLERWLSPVWMGILLRLEGLLIAAIAVQMLVAGISGAFGFASRM
jgi:small neutral amino acid transporter SnatA (MarC family)